MDLNLVQQTKETMGHANYIGMNTQMNAMWLQVLSPKECSILYKYPDSEDCPMVPQQLR